MVETATNSPVPSGRVTSPERQHLVENAGAVPLGTPHRDRFAQFRAGVIKSGRNIRITGSERPYTGAPGCPRAHPVTPEFHFMEPDGTSPPAKPRREGAGGALPPPRAR